MESGRWGQWISSQEGASEGDGYGPCLRDRRLNPSQILPRPQQGRVTRSWAGGASRVQRLGLPEAGREFDWISDEGEVLVRFTEKMWEMAPASKPDYSIQSLTPPQSSQSSTSWPRQPLLSRACALPSGVRGSSKDGPIAFPRLWLHDNV